MSDAAWLYVAGMVCALAGGTWAAWQLALGVIERWAARRCPMAPPETAAAAVDRWHHELPEVAPCPPLTADEQAILDALDFNPRPRPIRRSKP